MTPEKYSDHLLEQYKLYVEMADRVSQRREQSNRFYMTVVAAIFAILIVVARLGVADGVWPSVFLTSALLISGLFGVALSVVWLGNIRAYRELNTAKLDIIGKMEEELPVAPYTDERELLRSNYYYPISQIEQFVPVLFALLFAALFAYGLHLLLSSC